MSLKAADLTQIMRLIEESTIDELSLEMDGLKLSLRRGAALAPSGEAPLATQRIANGVAPAALPVTAPSGPAGVPAMSPPADPNVQDVVAPLLGTFYRAPKPGAPPFVEVGTAVDTDTVVGIIEVMKLMNTVRAGARGTVTEILARDGALVEYSETLVRIRKTA